MPLGLYISVPFCRSKCTYCNFASDVFSRAVFEKYVTRLREEISQARETARQTGAPLESKVDSVYFGGGTPTLLDVAQLESVFVTIQQNFEVQAGAEITVECAPGTLNDQMLRSLAGFGVSRVSLGVQSFVDQEAASVARLHKRTTVVDDVARLRAAGISNINVDLIAGLPHQTAASWQRSLDELLMLEVPHASVYMLEVDDDSRLGRELLAGGKRYHAHFVPDEDLTADLYEIACARLNSAGINQYEISNFARPGFESTHNLKYWTRQPYLGFGVDAHSMLPLAMLPLAMLPLAKSGAVRFSNPDSLDQYLAGAAKQHSVIRGQEAVEEAFFLGLRLNRGIDVEALREQFGTAAICAHEEAIAELLNAGLLETAGSSIRLTRRGRLFSNEVFERFISANSAV
jgi:oxygen-independent coproporphyrinogen-3 oxidase